jgi:circadian clock protein KaiB
MSKNEQDQSRPIIESTEVFELALKETDNNTYELKLYVSGMTPNSLRAIENVQKLCKVYLEGRYNLEIIDLYQQPNAAKVGQIVAAPTLVKEMPLPLRKFIGDMTKTDRILLRMDIKAHG